MFTINNTNLIIIKKTLKLYILTLNCWEHVHIVPSEILT